MIRAALVAAALLSAPAASANTIPASEMKAALTVAQVYWGVQPTCGVPSQVWVSLPPEWAEANADPYLCQIGYNAYWRDRGTGIPWATLCTLTVHEYGHLVLGPAFGAVNDDPWHSPDPGNIMFQAPSVIAQCLPPVRTPARCKMMQLHIDGTLTCRHTTRRRHHMPRTATS